MNVVRPMMVALLAANLVNAAGNWIFIYGHFGMPALGVRGIGVCHACGARVSRALPCSS